MVELSIISLYTYISQILDSKELSHEQIHAEVWLLFLFVDTAGYFSPDPLPIFSLHSKLNQHRTALKKTFHVQSLSTVMWCWNCPQSPLGLQVCSYMFACCAWSLTLHTPCPFPHLPASGEPLKYICTQSASLPEEVGWDDTHNGSWLLWQGLLPVPASHGMNRWRAAGLHVIGQQRLCTKRKVTQIIAGRRGAERGGESGGSESPNYQATVTGCAYSPAMA